MLQTDHTPKDHPHMILMGGPGAHNSLTECSITFASGVFYEVGR